MKPVETHLATLYESYDIMNRVCWRGELPPCLLRMSRRMSMRGSRCVAAYARNRGGGEYRIVFNAAFCRPLDDADFMQLMAHEMIHIWQYSRGSRGGHGRDFRDEQRRLGLIQGRVIPGTSPMGYVFFMHDLKNLHPAEAARDVAACPDARKRETEFFANRIRLKRP